MIDDDEVDCLEPARTVLTRLGQAVPADIEVRRGKRPSVIGRGIMLAQKITGRHLSRVYRWGYPRERRGYNGVIPHEDAQKLLDYAGKHGIKLRPEDFFAARGKR